MKIIIERIIKFDRYDKFINTNECILMLWTSHCILVLQLCLKKHFSRIDEIYLCNSITTRCIMYMDRCFLSIQVPSMPISFVCPYYSSTQGRCFPSVHYLRSNPILSSIWTRHWGMQKYLLGLLTMVIIQTN